LFVRPLEKMWFLSEMLSDVVGRVFPAVGRRYLTTGDDDTVQSTTDSLESTIVINIIIFLVLMTLFEINRHFKSIYFTRLQTKFKRTKRVPMEPAWYPFAWIVEIYKVSEDELLRMVGLDAYMMVRYLSVCFRSSLFLSFFGIVVLVPVYATAGGDAIAWNKYTLANVPDLGDDTQAQQLWVPAIFAYVFSAYYCFLLHSEYKNFMEKRLRYLMEGDPNTPPQTYYTVMLEHLPSQLRSVESLKAFFETIYPGQVHSVELTLDLGELDSVVARRRDVRDKLEHAIAAWEASHRKTRPTIWVNRSFYAALSNPLPTVGTSPIGSCLGYGVYDAIDHHTKVLGFLNTRVQELQKAYIEQLKKNENDELARESSLKGRLELETRKYIGLVRDKVVDNVTSLRDGISSRYGGSPGLDVHTPDSEIMASNNTVGGTIHGSSNRENHSVSPVSETKSDNNDNENSAATAARVIQQQGTTSATETEPASASSGASRHGDRSVDRHHHSDRSTDRGSLASLSAGSGSGVGEKFTRQVKAVVDTAHVAVETGVDRLAKEAKLAASSALKGALEATRTIELLTLGAYYKTSTTAFVTFRTRVASCTAHNVLLSHVYYTMKVKPAPNSKDVLWDNVSIPYRQVTSRTSIADAVLMFGGMFWSIIVASITAIANLEAISKEKGWHWLEKYQGTEAYKFLNTYLALGLLLILLALLPLIFDLIARYYEGIKLESEIQNSIMTRYFYYQLANVFVSVGLGSIANSLNQVNRCLVLH
jgi:hypothetical protein